MVRSLQHAGCAVLLRQGVGVTPKHQGRALALAAAGSLALSLPVFAQSDDRGGVTISMNVAESLNVTRNPGLVPGGDDVAFQSITALGFGYLTENRTQSFAVSAGVDLRAVFGTDIETEFELGDRVLDLSYALDGARSTLDLVFGARQIDIQYYRPLEDFTVNGEFVAPESFDDLIGNGTRTDLSFDGGLSLRDDAPFGILVGLDAYDVSYRNTTAPDLVDSTRVGFDIDTRLDLNPVIQAIAGVRYSYFTDDNGVEDDSVTLSAGMSFAQPTGSLAFNIFATPADAGTQYAFDVSRRMEFPDSALEATAGVALTATDTAIVTGGLSYELLRPNGVLNASFDHTVGSDAGVVGDVTTTVAVQGETALTPDLSAALSAVYARNQEFESDTITVIADFGASVEYALSADWSLGAGANYVVRDSNVVDTAASQSLSLTVTRTFDARY